MHFLFDIRFSRSLARNVPSLIIRHNEPRKSDCPKKAAGAPIPMWKWEMGRSGRSLPGLHWSMANRRNGFALHSVTLDGVIECVKRLLSEPDVAPICPDAPDFVHGL